MRILDNQKKGISPWATGLAGVVIGAGMGVAATRFLTDKKTRDMVMNAVSDVKDKIVSYSHQIRRSAKKATESAQQRLRGRPVKRS